MLVNIEVAPGEAVVVVNMGGTIMTAHGLWTQFDMNTPPIPLPSDSDNGWMRFGRGHSTDITLSMRLFGDRQYVRSHHSLLEEG